MKNSLLITSREGRQQQRYIIHANNNYLNRLNGHVTQSHRR